MFTNENNNLNLNPIIEYICNPLPLPIESSNIDTLLLNKALYTTNLLAHRSSTEIYLHPYQSTLSEGLLSWSSIKDMKENNIYSNGNYRIPSFVCESLPTLMINHIKSIINKR